MELKRVRSEDLNSTQKLYRDILQAHILTTVATAHIGHIKKNSLHVFMCWVRGRKQERDNLYFIMC